MSHANALSQLAVHTGSQKHAVLIIAAAPHSFAGIDVFLDRMLGKPFGGDDWDLVAGKLFLDGLRCVSLVFLSHNTGNTAEMVGVRVRNDDGLDRIFAQIFLYQLHCRLTAFHAHQCVEDDPACVTLDNSEVGHVVAPYLIDALADFKKSVDMIVLRVFPQAGVHAVGSLFVIVQKSIGFLTPEDVSLLILQFQCFRRIDQAACCELIFLFIVEIKLIINCGICLSRKICGRLDFGIQSEIRFCCVLSLVSCLCAGSTG